MSMVQGAYVNASTSLAMGVAIGSKSGCSKNQKEFVIFEGADPSLIDYEIISGENKSNFGIAKINWLYIEITYNGDRLTKCKIRQLEGFTTNGINKTIETYKQNFEDKVENILNVAKNNQRLVNINICDSKMEKTFTISKE